MPWYLYIIRCKDNSLYIGSTKELCRRLEEHTSQGPRCAKYLRGKGPLTLVFSILLPERTDALRAEILLKKKPKPVKEALVRGQLSLDSVLDQKVKNKRSDIELLPMSTSTTV